MEPLLVVHGIGNRDSEAFRHTMAPLEKSLGDRYRLVPVFWGDLGGISQSLEDSLPLIVPRATTTRGGETQGGVQGKVHAYDDLDAVTFFDLFQKQRLALMGAQLTRSEEDSVVDALYRETLKASGADLDSAPAHLTRRGDVDDLRQALEEVISQTEHLQHVYDPALQEVVGQLIAEYVKANPEIYAPTSGHMTTAQIMTRGWLANTKSALQDFVMKVDLLIGKTAGTVGGGLSQWVRGALAEPIALTLGDIVAYHQRRHEIHKRLFEVLDLHAAGWGTREQPITVVAHSLGGLVTLDAALGSDAVQQDGQARMLHIKRWVTFGSQPAFFHVLAPRNGIAPYRTGEPSRLPPSIGAWTNLWHPLDVLSFSATPVFTMSDGSVPRDQRVDTAASAIAQAKGWLHSIYWNCRQLPEAIR